MVVSPRNRRVPGSWLLPRRPLRWSLALSLTLPLGCRHPELHTVGTNAPGRHVIRASQYAFTTDYEMDDGDPLVTDLVDLREVVSRSLGIPAGNSLVRIVVFENQQRFVEFIRLNFPDLPPRRAFFLKQNGDQLTVFACRGETLKQDLRHEVTHALLNGVLPGVPLWLDEGLAEYFEVEADQNHVSRPHVQRLQAEHAQGRRFDLARLEELDNLWQMRSADYRESWLWVHFCLNHSPESRAAFFDYLAEIRAGHRGPLQPRLAQAVPNLDHALAEHLRSLHP